MKNSLIYVLLLTCIFVAGTAQPAVTQDQKPPTPAPTSTHAGVCRNEASGDSCPCNPKRARNNKDVCVPDPCLEERQAYDDAVAAQSATQQKVRTINSSAKEKAMNEIRLTKPDEYNQWKKDADAATKANIDAANKVNDATKKLDACIAANNMHPR